MSDTLENTLAEALAELVTVVETCDGDTLAPDTAVTWLESTGYLLNRLPVAERHTLDRLFREAALRRPPGAWRERMLKVSEGFGLTEDAHGAACDAVERHTRRLVETVRHADPATPVPTCPGWTLADLVRHVGTVHRWTEHLVRTGATTRVRAAEVPLDLPAGPAGLPDWLAAGAETALATLRAADPGTPVWSPGGDPHVRYFPRHVLFETVVHLSDAELALGREPGLAPGTAADGIDAFLENLPYLPEAAEQVARLDRDGTSIRLTATDSGAAWTVVLGGGGFTWHRRGEGAASAAVEGAAADLLLFLYGRRGPEDPCLTASGDRTLLDVWSAATAR